jgi:hypothetical protein
LPEYWTKKSKLPVLYTKSGEISDMGAVVHNIGSVLVVLSSASIAFASEQSE